MDYESRKVKWYWVFAFCAYCVAVAYLLFKGNPLLYSKLDLRSSLDQGEFVHRQTIPAHPEEIAESAPTFYQRYNFQRTATDPQNSPRAKGYEEYEHKAIDFEAENLDAQNVTGDASGFFVSGKTPWAAAISADGSIRWKYRFKDLPAGKAIYPVLVDENSAYLIHPMGDVVCLNKATGEIRWVNSVKSEVVADPVIWKKALIIPSKSSNGVQMIGVDRVTGHVDEDSPNLDLKPGFLLSHAPELGALIATVDNNVIALDPTEWQMLWSVTLTDPIKGPVVVAGTQLYAATLAAKVVKIDGAKKGKVDWEAEIVKPPASSPTYLPAMNRLSILDTSGALSHIDAKSGKVYWRVAAENRNPLTDTWSARLKSKYIEEYSMDWLHKGWTIWTPCYDSSFCVFTPKSGLITRIKLSGRPVALPVALDHRWLFLSHTKGSEYVVSQMLEDAEIKQIKAEKEKPAN